MVALCMCATPFHECERWVEGAAHTKRADSSLGLQNNNNKNESLRLVHIAQPLLSLTPLAPAPVAPTIRIAVSLCSIHDIFAFIGFRNLIQNSADYSAFTFLFSPQLFFLLFCSAYIQNESVGFSSQIKV